MPEVRELISDCKTGISHMLNKLESTVFMTLESNCLKFAFRVLKWGWGAESGESWTVFKVTGLAVLKSRVRDPKPNLNLLIKSL